MAYDKRYLLAVYLLHPFISLTTPFLFLLALDASLRQWISWPDLTTFPQYLLLPLTGISKLLLLQIFAREKLKGIARLQEFIYTFIFLYLLSSLMRWQGFPESFILRLENTYILFFALLQWLLTFVLARNLLARSAMLKFFAENKDNPLSSKTLFEGLLLESYSGIQRLNNILGGLLALSLSLLFLVWLLRLPGKFYIFLWLVPSFLALLISRLLVSLFLREEYLYSAGFKPLPVSFQRLGLWLVLLLSISFIFAFLLSTNSSLFDLQNLPLPTLTLQEEESPLDDRPLPALPVEDLPVTSFTQALAGFLQGVLLILGLIAISFVAVFLLSPFFSKSFWRFLAQRRPLKALIDFLKKLALLLGEACKILIQLVVLLFTSKSSVGRANVLRSLWRPEKRLSGKRKALLTKTRHQAKVVRLFYRLIKWARLRGLSYSVGQTATAFICHLASYYPQKRVELDLILSIFTEALFAGRPLASFKLKQYQEALKRVCQEKRPLAQ